ncbi:hypothetical protein F6E22_17450 [Vibrio vulnificus]|nr:hypothetical protein [Vibrio vulnificus]
MGNKKKRMECLADRIERVVEILDTYIKTPSLKVSISNMDQLASKLARETGIGYSTLLKSTAKGGYYREYLDSALLKIAPSMSKIGSLAQPEPKNWVHQKAIYESKIGILNEKINKLRLNLQQVELALSTVSQSKLTLHEVSDIRQADIGVEMLCRALARILDHEEVGLDLMPDGSIEYFGETLVSSDQAQPYLTWQERTKPAPLKG